MADDKSLRFQIITTADDAGLQKVDQGFKKVTASADEFLSMAADMRQRTLDWAEANGAGSATLEKLAGDFDKVSAEMQNIFLTSKDEQEEQQRTVALLKEAALNMQKYVEAEKQAAAAAEASARQVEKTAEVRARAAEKSLAAINREKARMAKQEADERAAAEREQIRMADMIAKEAERTARQMKQVGEQAQVMEKFNVGAFTVTREKAVMMGNAMAGLVTQMAMGSDATSLLASGMTNAAMIMSSAGPWGIAAGFMLQALTAIGVKMKQTSDEAAAAAKKQEEAAARTQEALRNMAAAEESYGSSVEKSKRAIDQKVSSLQEQERREKDLADRLQTVRESQDKLAEAQDQADVASGDLTPAEALQNKQERERKALEEKQAADLEANRRAEREGITAKAQVEQEFGAKQEAADKAQQAADAAPKLAKIEEQIQKRREALEAIDRELLEMADAAEQGAPVSDAKMKSIRDDQARLMKEQQDLAAGAKAIRGQMGPVQRQDGKVDVDYYQREAAKAKQDVEKALPDAAERQRRAQEQIDKAQLDRETGLPQQQDAETRLLKNKQEQESKAAELDAAKADNAKASQGLGEMEGKLKTGLESMATQVQATNAAMAQQIRDAAAALNDGSTQQEMERIASLMHQFTGSLNTGLRDLSSTMETCAQQGANNAAEIARLKSQIEQLSQRQRSSI